MSRVAVWHGAEPGRPCRGRSIDRRRTGARTSDPWPIRPRPRPPRPRQAPARRPASRPRRSGASRRGRLASPASSGVATIPIRAKNGHIQLMLTQNVADLGQPGDLVNVRPGFAPQLPRSRRAWPPSPPRTTCGWSRSTASGSASSRKPAAPTCMNLAAQIAQRSLDDRGQRQRRRASLRLGQRRSDRRRAPRRGLPDRGRERPDRRPAQGARPLHDQAPPRPGHRHRGQALGRPDPHRGSQA